MRAVPFLIGGLTLALASAAEINDAPSYSAAGIVNAADNQPGHLAPNTIASLYGVRLSYITEGVTPADIQGGMLRTELPGTGVQVLVRNSPAAIYYVSPNQINFLVPANLLPGPAAVQVVLEGHAGPPVDIKLAAAAPALFQIDQRTAVALHADGSVITSKAPAKPGEVVILYATGLGQTSPPVSDGQVLTEATPIAQLAEFKLILDGVKAGAAAVVYAGIAPDFAGLYQLNLILPKSTKENPEIRIGLGDQLSRTALHLPVKP